MSEPSPNLHPLLDGLLRDLGIDSDSPMTDVVVGREVLADAIGSFAEKIGDDGRSRAAHASALALVVLAEQHHLDEPQSLRRSARAELHVGRCLSRWPTLRPSTRALMLDAYHRIACNPDTASFVRSVRAEVESLDLLDPLMIDVDDRERLLLGGRALRVPYRDPAGSARMRRLSSGNREGRLLLLLTLDRAPRIFDADLVSRLRHALSEHEAVSGVRLEGSPLRLTPTPGLSARARSLATEVRGVRV